MCKFVQGGELLRILFCGNCGIIYSDMIYYLYKKLGYKVFDEEQITEELRFVYMEKV